MPITPLPTPPNRNQSADAFSLSADAFLAALPVFGQQANALASAVAASAQDALDAARLSEAAYAAVRVFANAEEWSAEAMYMNGNCVFASNGHTYRCIGANTNKPPETNTGTYWIDLSNAGLTLGVTAQTAYRGDLGQTAYTHSQAAHAPATAQKNSDITKAEIEARLTGTLTSHAHSYAGASTPGGAASTAQACTGNAATASACTGNAATATKLQTARTIALSGDVSGSASFDGSGNVTITTAVANDSHAHSGYLSTDVGAQNIGSTNLVYGDAGVDLVSGQTYTAAQLNLLGFHLMEINHMDPNYTEYDVEWVKGGALTTGTWRYLSQGKTVSVYDYVGGFAQRIS